MRHDVRVLQIGTLMEYSIRRIINDQYFHNRNASVHESSLSLCLSLLKRPSQTAPQSYTSSGLERVLRSSSIFAIFRTLDPLRNAGFSWHHDSYCSICHVPDCIIDLMRQFPIYANVRFAPIQHQSRRRLYSYAMEGSALDRERHTSSRAVMVD